MIDLFIKIGFLPITIWDMLDILIVGYLIFQAFKLLKGSLAFNIFIAILVLFTLSGLVRFLEMGLLSKIMEQFGNLGVLALLIVFQPEVRRFLIVLGRGTLKGQYNFWKRLIQKDFEQVKVKENLIREVIRALESMSKFKVGALMIFSMDPNLQGYTSSGVTMNAEISSQLLESIFNKDSPLHDGAVIISRGKIVAASCVLPVSENPDLPQSAGLRHRAAVGITEGTEALAVIVSEETGRISMARSGKLNTNLNGDQLDKFLRTFFAEQEMESIYPETEVKESA